MKYSRAKLREGTESRLRTQLKSARHFIASLEGQLTTGGLDVVGTAEALSTTTDRILESAAALRALDSLEET